MTRPELHITLSQMLDAMSVPDIPNAPITTEAMIDAAVEISWAMEDGQLVAAIAPPASRFVSGVQNPIHRMRFTATRVDFDGEAVQ
jgi:hypothetical protein